MIRSSWGLGEEQSTGQREPGTSKDGTPTCSEHEVKDHRCQAERGHVSFRMTTAQTAKLPLSQLYATVSKRPWQEGKIQQQIGGKVAQLRAHSMDVQYWAPHYRDVAPAWLPSSLLHSTYFIVHTPESSGHSQAAGRTEGD